MGDTIDVHGLPEEQVKLIRDFIEFLKGKAKKKEAKRSKKEQIAFADWPLKVKGTLIREEIYDHL
jgi:hypothetical protein